MLGDVVLTKADAFQGKRKVKDQWSKVEYEIVCQVKNGVPSYEIKDASDRLFLVATLKVHPQPCAKARMLTLTQLSVLS